MNKRLLSMFLALCMIVTMLPVSAMAEEIHTAIGGRVEIISFAPLTETKKAVSLGTSIEDLELPETLTATVRTAVPADENSTQDSGSPETATPTTAAEPEWEETTGDIPVEWDSPDYDMDTEGVYIFTPVIVGYTVSAPLPELTVTVGEPVLDMRGIGLLSIEDTDVAAIDDTGYATLQEAVNAVAEGQTIKLLDDINLTATVETLSSSTKSFTLDLNGKMLRSSDKLNLLHRGSGTLTVTDSKGGGKIEHGSIWQAISNLNYGTIIVSDTEIITTSGDGRGIVNVAGTLVVSRSKVSGGTGIENSSGTVTISNSTITGTSSSGNAYGIYSIQKCTINISGSTISGEGNGSGLYGIRNTNGGTVNVSGSPSVIKGKSYAMHGVTPTLNGVIATASADYDGGSAVAYDAGSIASYKYLKFEPAPVVNYDLWVGGVRVTSDNKDGITGAGITGTVIYDSDTNTLTLNGATINGAYEGTWIDSTTSAYYGIYADTALKIEMVGDSTIMGKNLANIASIGIYTGSTLNLSGSGSLYVSGGTGKFSVGIYSGGSITIEGGRVTAVGAAATQTSIGIASNGNITIHDGEVEALANTGASISWGMMATNAITINDGEVTASGKTGLHTNAAAGSVTISDGMVTANGSEVGIAGAVTVTGGTVTVKSDAKALNGSLTTSGYEGCIVTAGANKNGDGAGAYNAENLATYKYIKVEPGVASTNVAQIGSTGYPTLQAAVDAVSDGQTITLLDDINLTTTVEIPSTMVKSFALDLNGKTLSANKSTVITHLGTGTLTIADSVSGGMVIGHANSSTINNFGIMHISGGTVSSTYINTTTIFSSGSLHVSGGIVRQDGGGSQTIYNTGTVTVSGGMIEHQNGSAIINYDSGNIIIASGTPVIKGSHMVMNTPPDLSGYANVRITASKTKIDGTETSVITKEDIDTNIKVGAYKYLKFEPDVISPVLSAGSVDRTSDIAATIGFTTDKAGTAYYLVTDSGAAAPVSMAVKAGTSLGSVNGTVTGKAVTLTAGAKDIYVVVEDSAGNISTPLKIEAAAYVAPDTTAPVVSSVTVPTNGTYLPGTYLDFTVNFSESVAVTGSPYISLTIGLDSRNAIYQSGSGTTALVFRYTVQADDSDSDGITVGTSLNASGGTIRDAAGNDANLALNSVGSTGGVLVNPPAPSISGQPSPQMVDEGQTATFSVTATGEGLTYKWQVDTGSGFSYIPNGGVYSGATTATLTITGITAGMNGYQYRAVVAGTYLPAVTSNSVLLTVNAAPTYTITAAPTSKDFGSLAVGYSAPATQTVTITNTGNSSVTLTQPTSTNYSIGALSTTTLAANGTATFTVAPKASLAVGNYNETLTVSTNHSTNATVELSFSVTAVPTYTITADPVTKDFGSLTIGYIAPAAQTVTITNTGNSSVTLIQPTSTNYTIGTLSTTTLAANGTATFTVAPKAGLAVGNYNETLTVSTNQSTNATVSLSFSVTAAPNYTVTFNPNDGTVSETSRLVAPGAAVGTLPTPTRSGSYSFDGWYTAASGGIQISAGTTVSANVTYYAHWTYTGGGGGGGGSSSNDNSSPVIVTPPAPDKPNSPTQGEIKVPGTVDGKGNVTVSLTDKTVTDAFDKALAEAKKNGTEQNGITVVLRVDTGSKTGSHVTVNLPKAVQDAIIAKKIVNTIVVVDNPDIRVGMDLATVQEINKQAKSDVNITATRTDSGKLTTEAKKAIGSRPVFDLKVNYGNGKAVSSFGSGSVSVTIPYTLGANEKAGNVQAVYVDSKGKVHWLINSVYDSAEKVLRFSTDHFSTYGIGYKQANTAFTDIAGHWAKEDIEFVASRGLFSGTSETKFSPNTAMTRGMFVTALGRLANADVSGYAKSTFSDVKDDAYYMGYIEWASKNNIVNGVGNGKFAPDQSITREQMAVIMSNYAKTIGCTLPKVHVENIFADNGKISTYAKEAVKQMQMAGVISGKNGNLYDPQGTATRAEVSAVLRRFVKLAISSDTAQGWSMNDSGKWMYFKDGKPLTGKQDIDGATYTFDQYGVTADVPKNLRYTTYTVQKGDSFWSISRKLGCPMSELERLNNKSRFSLILPGEVLRVPEK